MTPTQLLKEQLEKKDMLIGQRDLAIRELERQVAILTVERDAARRLQLNTQEARSQLLILKATMKSACDRIGSICGVEQ